MKAKTLISLLSSTERTLLVSVKQVAERPAALKLTHYLFSTIDSGSLYSKEEAFSAAFGKPLTAEDDFRLRHELRIVTKACEAFLTERQLEKHKERQTGLDDYLLGEALLERRAYNLLEQELKRMKKRYINYPLTLKLDMENLLRSFEYELIKQEPYSENLAEKVIRFLNTWLDFEQLQAARRISIKQTDLISWQRELKNLTDIDAPNRPIKLQDPIDRLDLGQYFDDPLVKRNLLVQRYKQSNPEEGIEILKLIAEVENSETLAHPVYGKMLCLTYRRLGISYANSGELRSATQYFEKAVEQADKNNDTEMHEHFNLIVHYINIDAYQQAIDTFHTYRHKLSRCGHIPTLRTVIAACQIMLGHFDEAKKLVFMNSRISDFKRNTDRQLLAICFYEEGNFGLMERELENAVQLLKTNNYHNKEFFLSTCRMLLRFVHAIQLPKAERSKKLTKLKDDLDTIVAGSASLQPYVYVSLLWLKRKLQLDN